MLGNTRMIGNAANFYGAQFRYPLLASCGNPHVMVLFLKNPHPNHLGNLGLLKQEMDLLVKANFSFTSKDIDCPPTEEQAHM